MIKALGHFILVKVEQVEKVSKGGIVLVDQMRQAEMRAAEKGVIVDVGPTAWAADGLGGEPWAKVGDTVFFAKYAGKWVKETDEDEDELLILLDTDIQARVE